MIKYSSFGKSHIGLRRKVNEDNFCDLPNSNLWLVADGMGGHAAGDVASSLACQNVSELISCGCLPEDAIERVHQQIKKAGSENIERYQMGTTLVMAKAACHFIDVFWVGDSRAYLLNSEGLNQLTKDHSLVQKMIDSHLISEEEARHHPKRNVISQCLGATNLDKLDVGNRQIDIQQGDRILLCSDGLHGELNSEQIEAVLRASNSPQQAAEQLIEQANEQGGSDNITVIAIFTD